MLPPPPLRLLCLLDLSLHFPGVCVCLKLRLQMPPVNGQVSAGSTVAEITNPTPGGGIISDGLRLLSSQ